MFTKIRDWFEEKILDIPLVSENIKNSYESGFLDGTNSSVVAERNDEMLAIIRRIEQLKKDESTIENEIIERRAQELLDGLLSPVDLRHIVRLDTTSKRIKIGNEYADEAMLGNLNAEAKFLTESTIWKLIQESPKELASRQMFVASESLDDLKKGKSILYTLDAQRNIVELLKNIK